MNTYKAKIISVSRKIPIPKYPEFDFELKIDDAYGTINPHYKTTLAFLYSENHDSTKAIFLSINSKTGKPKIDLFERLTLNRSECKLSPSSSYNNFNIDAWIGTEGEFVSSCVDNNN